MSTPPIRFRDNPHEEGEASPIDIGSSWKDHDLNEEAQREQDLEAARLMSMAREHTSSSHLWMDGNETKLSTPMAAMPMRGSQNSAALKRFYRHNAGSTASLDSQHHFIDHRNQSHSLSVNPNSPLAIRAMQGAKSMHDPPEGEGDAHLADETATKRDQPTTATSPTTHPDREYGGSYQESTAGSLHGMMQSSHTTAGRDTPLEDDVCFPPPNHVDEQPMHEKQGSVSHNAAPPGYPYTFDLTALDSFVQEERERQGHIGSFTHLSSFGSGSGARSQFGYSLTGGDAKLYSRRPRRAQTGLSEGGGKYQRKLAMFEGGHSFGQASESPKLKATSPLSMEPDDANRPLLKGTSQPTYHGMPRDEPPAQPSLTRAQTVPNTRAPRSSVPIPGTAHDKPYRFTFYSNALPSTIHARYLSELPGQGQSFEDLFRGVPSEADMQEMKEKSAPLIPGVPMLGGEQSHEPDSKTWWLDVLCPTDQEMKVLARTFGIHPLTTEDILMEETREKIELFRNYYLVCFRSFDQDPYSPTYLEPLNMYIIVFREGTLSFHFRQTPHPQNVRRRIKQLKDYINVTSDWISYALIDDITDAFAPLIQSIEFEVDSIDELVLILKEAEQSDMLRRIGTCRKKVMGLLRLMGNKADVVKGLAKRSNEYWSVAPKSDIGMYLSDIQDHLITMTQNLNHYEMILSRSHSNYLAQISIEMTDANNQINDVLSKLTALGTVIVPMNVITGLWGMNVQVPGQNVENLNWFGGICAVMVVIAVSGYITTVRYLSGR
ncbi:CorA metal ion transporter [Malassezia pachydermatis]|uniref:Mnr2-manganese resistance protein n=1 Tax=Malassezia pachydermatis TaxID=77020 RepID=A0A0M8MM72_9BASI|nr:mnr2-manganese resistance protein [Malassezia pachydermatis]KOS12937.1 mnr2-manganese resistance protein [Malassezia pachydermatis]